MAKNLGRVRIVSYGMIQMLHIGTLEPLDRLCACVDGNHFFKEYRRLLRHLDLLPITTFLDAKRTVRSILNSFTLIKDWHPDIPEEICKECTPYLRGDHIRRMIDQFENYWDGLCMDCMHWSGSGDNRLYKTQNGPGRWGIECRMGPHGQQTWKVSNFGPPDDHDDYEDERQNKEMERARSRSILNPE
jgi:hypothetical protein